jgi:intracellular sulfur oxidation DsrE/DsrF family protein
MFLLPSSAQYESEVSMSEHTSSPHARRFFLTQVAPGLTALGVAAVTANPAAAQSVEAARWQPERHTQDDWLDLPGKHRLVFDTTEQEGLSNALLYATNYYSASNSAYGLQNSDLAVVVIARHTSTPYAYTDAIWSKYGVPISNFVARGKEPSMTNAYNRQLSGLVGRGMHVGVCQLATRAISGAIARSVNANVDDIYNEIAANLLPNSHLVPAGIIAVNRAQERGYTLV